MNSAAMKQRGNSEENAEDVRGVRRREAYDTRSVFHPNEEGPMDWRTYDVLVIGFGSGYTRIPPRPKSSTPCSDKQQGPS